LLSPDFVFHYAGLLQPHNGEQYIQVNRAAKTAFSDLKRTVDDLIAEGDTVAVRITALGTHTGTFQGIAARGWQTEITGIAIRRMGMGKLLRSG
jgi:predicted ester cyclase